MAYSSGLNSNVGRLNMNESISNSLALIFQGIEGLRQSFTGRKFTIDGRLVGDLGEVIAELEYDLELDGISQPTHDATCSKGRRIQIKATFQKSLTFSTTPDYYIGLKLNQDGSYEEVFNGPGSLIYSRFSHRKGIGEKLLSFPVKELKLLSSSVPEEQRIPRRHIRSDSFNGHHNHGDN